MSTASRLATGTYRNGTPHDTSCTGRSVRRMSSGLTPRARAMRVDSALDAPELWQRLCHPHERQLSILPDESNARGSDVEAERERVRTGSNNARVRDRERAAHGRVPG